MRAFLLAAGDGTRLRPLTETVPKCLVPIKGVPLLNIWFDLLKLHGVTVVLVNLHYLPHLVQHYINSNVSEINVRTFYEETLLGTAGTVLANRDFVRDERCFVIAYADNLTNVNLKRMVDFHVERGGVLTVGLFRAEAPEECGIAEIDGENVITSFTEKPTHPVSNLANAGIYIAGQELFDYIPMKKFVDFGFDVLPHLVGKMYGYVIEEYLIDIGDPANYKRANEQWEGL
jgi:mannose-1-phosphate guanylyltransferase